MLAPPLESEVGDSAPLLMSLSQLCCCGWTEEPKNLVVCHMISMTYGGPHFQGPLLHVRAQLLQTCSLMNPLNKHIYIYINIFLIDLSIYIYVYTQTQAWHTCACEIVFFRFIVPWANLPHGWSNGSSQTTWLVQVGAKFLANQRKALGQESGHALRFPSALQCPCAFKISLGPFTSQSPKADIVTETKVANYPF